VPFPTILLPGPTRLRLTTLTTTTERIILDLTATQHAACCPTCASETTRIHSHYQRTVADLPWASLPVQLHLHVRRFMCDNPACARVTFAEPLPEVVVLPCTQPPTGDPALGILTEHEIAAAKFAPPVRNCLAKAFIFTYRRSF